MEIQYKTQCPHCATQFKLSESQLAQAGGMVRCGKCLKPFQATDYLVDVPRKSAPAKQAAPSPAKQTARAPASARQVAKPTSEEQWAKQLLEKEGLAPRETAPQPKSVKNTSRWQMPQEAPARRNDEDTLSLGEAIEISDELENIQAGGFTDFNADDFGNLEGAGRRKHSDASDEDWARQLLEDDDKPAVPQPRTERPAAPRRKPVNTKPQSTPPSSLFDFDESELNLGPLGTDNRNDQYEQAMARVGYDRTSYFIKWTSLSLLLLFVLGGQYLVFNFQSLARDPGFRPFYAQACQLLGCELPSNFNIDLLQPTNLLVRGMDDQPGALLVDLLLHNQADHAQPFPYLQLTFNGLQDQLMAVGVFSPADYLQNSLAGMKSLPPQAQIHLSFRITDPGPDAKNYWLKLLPPPHA